MAQHGETGLPSDLARLMVELDGRFAVQRRGQLGAPGKLTGGRPRRSSGRPTKRRSGEGGQSGKAQREAGEVLAVPEGTGVDGAARDRWRAVRNVKRYLAPNCYARSAAHGSNMPFGEAAQHMAQHLAGKQWEQHRIAADHEGRNGLVSRVARFDTGVPTTEHVATVIAALARSKSEGVDVLQAELLQSLDEGNQEWLAA